MVTKARVLTGLRIAAPFGVAAICLALVVGKLEAGVLAAVPYKLSELSALQVIAAICATLVSFWAVGRYDVVTHRALGTGITARRAQIAGTSAIALSQTLGFGVFTAAIARWRLLPDFSLPSALRVSAFVSVSFILALALICALLWLVLPMPGWVGVPAVAILITAPILLGVSLWLPALPFFGHRLRLPNLTTCAAIFGWTIVDTFAAAIALYVLMPSADLTFDMVLTAYLLALGAGLISGAPGGVGPFELALLAALPPESTAQVLAAALAFRMIYYAVPAIFGGLMLIRPLRVPDKKATPSPSLSTRARRSAELGILRQNNGKIAVFPGSVCALWPTAQTLCMMFDPLAGDNTSALHSLKTAAKARNRLPLLYKCTARTAVAARQADWQVVHLADEAVLYPSTFDPSIRDCRELRRKLRQAARAGVKVSHPTALPLRAMAQIDANWQGKKGPARGGSMGRFCPDYLSHQRVYLAHHEGQLVGYISFHLSADEWCLDLMRQRSDAPQGTMQILVKIAIEQARDQGIDRLSLAATPAKPPINGPLIKFTLRHAKFLHKTAGLKRFKSSFGPRWQPRYAAAPTMGALALGLFDISRSIHNPLPLAKTNPPHKEDEECEVALNSVP